MGCDERPRLLLFTRFSFAHEDNLGAPLPATPAMLLHWWTLH